MNDSGFIFLLALGATLLVGILTVVHVSSRNLSKRVADRRAHAVAKEPEFDFGEFHDGYGSPAGDVMGPLMHTGGGGRRF